MRSMLAALMAVMIGTACAGPALAEAPKAEPIDINSASADQLGNLPGIGAGYVKKIVEGRPYGSTEDLVKKKILPPMAYERLKDQITVGRK